MIVFVPSAGDGDSWQLQVATTAVVGRDWKTGPCVFDPNEMSAAGGSLVIESREEANPPRFRLHWAGQHTAKGSGDCGAAADLTLDRYDLQRLANAAGGFGVRPRAFGNQPIAGAPLRVPLAWRASPGYPADAPAPRIIRRPQ